MSLIVDIQKQMGDFHLDVSFDTGDGFHGLLGPSGCGKSMTLRCIAGVERPDAGRIEVNGVTLFNSEKGIDLPPQQRSVGLLFQNYALFPNMTVEQNLRTVTRSLSRSEADRRIDSMLRRFHLQDRRGHLPRQLSGGEQQRTALARILLTDPQILLLDEPLSALDSYLRWQTELELMETLEDFAGTVVLVTHNRKEVYRMCRTVSVLDHGHARGAHGTEKLFRHPRTLQECLLSGCKNYSRAEMLEDGRVYAADWGVTLKVSESTEGPVSYVGIQSHDLIPVDTEGENVVSCQVQRLIRDVNSAIVMTDTPGGTEGNHRFHAELSREQRDLWEDREQLQLYLPPEKLMLLR